MPQPYSETLNAEWAKKQNYSDVFWGDAIFEITKIGANRLENSWVNLAKPWDRLFDKAVQTGFMGWGAPIVDRRWLSYTFFGTEKYWPKGLTKKEKSLLRLAKAVSAYHPRDKGGWTVSQGIEGAEPEEATLAAMKSYAEKFEAVIASPMWTVFDDIGDGMAPLIMNACGEVYSEPCTTEESRGMFYGDLQRAWKFETLKWSHITYKVFGLFVDYTSATMDSLGAPTTR